jgi:hypothetical protein
VTFGDNTISIYIDGEFKASKSSSISGMASNIYSVFIGDADQGSCRSGMDAAFNGIIDELRMYNYVLSQEEIQTLYDNDKTDEVDKNEIEKEIYECPITISNLISKELIDYQIKIEITYSEILSKIHGHGADLRFFESQTTDPYKSPYSGLKYWVEPQDESGNKIAVWIKTNLSPLSSKIIYMYYGNSDEKYMDNGDDVFEFFDACDKIGSWNVIEEPGYKPSAPYENHYQSLGFNVENQDSLIFTSYFEDIGSKFVQWNYHAGQGFVVSSVIPYNYDQGSAAIWQDYGGGNNPGGIEFGLNTDLTEQSKTGHPTYNKLYKYEIVKNANNWNFNCIRISDESYLASGTKSGTIGAIKYIGWHTLRPAVRQNYVGTFGNGIHFKSRYLDSSSYNIVEVVYYGMHVRKYASTEPSIS